MLVHALFYSISSVYNVTDLQGILVNHYVLNDVSWSKIIY